MHLSVVICSHNPHTPHMTRVLNALQTQSLAQGDWELLLVDNGSSPPLADTWMLAWHPEARHVRENQLGLTHARLRGIREARGQLLLFVDDDNVLNQDYLQRALDIARASPHLGAFGGTATVEYDTPPSARSRDLADATALMLPPTRAIWSNRYDKATTPFGAGMVVRKHIADAYAALIAPDSRRVGLDKLGTMLTYCGDTDLAWTAIDQGLGCGIFPELSFTHLISARRTSEEYLLKVVEGFWFSWLLLHRLRKLPLQGFQPYQDRSTRLLWWWKHLRSSAFQKQVQMAERNGQWRAAAVPLH